MAFELESRNISTVPISACGNASSLVSLQSAAAMVEKKQGGSARHHTVVFPLTKRSHDPRFFITITALGTGGYPHLYR